jgi:hypothetical protein
MDSKNRSSFPQSNNDQKMRRTDEEEKIVMIPSPKHLQILSSENEKQSEAKSDSRQKEQISSTNTDPSKNTKSSKIKKLFSSSRLVQASLLLLAASVVLTPIFPPLAAVAVYASFSCAVGAGVVGVTKKVMDGFGLRNPSSSDSIESSPSNRLNGTQPEEGKERNMQPQIKHSMNHTLDGSNPHKTNIPLNYTPKNQPQPNNPLNYEERLTIIEKQIEEAPDLKAKRAIIKQNADSLSQQDKRKLSEKYPNPDLKRPEENEHLKMQRKDPAKVPEIGFTRGT